MAVLLLLAPGCEQGPVGETPSKQSAPRQVELRLTDSVWAKSFPAPMVTAVSPRVILAKETRPVLTKRPAKTEQGDLTHGRFTLDLPEGARVEFAVGVVAAGKGEGVKDALEARAQAELWIQNEAGRRRLWSRELPTARAPWQEYTVDLPSGSQQTLEFRVAAGAAVEQARFGDPVVTVLATSQSPVRGVILISLDTLRADRMSLYGYERSTAPKLEALFGDGSGVVFDKVYTQGPDTLLGHVAMLKGRTPASTLRAPGELMNHSLAFASLADVLRHHGYRTAAYTENAILAGNMGFNQGFEVWYENKDVELSPEKGHIDSTFELGMQWLRGHHEEPFFLFLHTYQVHAPYGAPAPWSELFPSSDDASDTERNSDAYDEGIAYADFRTAAFLDEVAALGLSDDVLVVVTSDHGEEFLEHGRLQHGTNLTQENLHVPLLMRGPGIDPGTAASRAPAALLDVAPTILDCLNLPAPASFQGISLRKPIKPGASAKERIIPHEAWSELAQTPTGFDSTFKPPSFGLTQGSLRVVRLREESGHRFEMYDLESDPGEKNDLVAAGAEVPEELRRYLRKYLDRQIGLHYTAIQQLGAKSTVPVAQATDEEHDAERIEKLKALGYIAD